MVFSEALNIKNSVREEEQKKKKCHTVKKVSVKKKTSTSCVMKKQIVSVSS